MAVAGGLVIPTWGESLASSQDLLAMAESTPATEKVQHQQISGRTLPLQDSVFVGAESNSASPLPATSSHVVSSGVRLGVRRLVRWRSKVTGPVRGPRTHSKHLLGTLRHAVPRAGKIRFAALVSIRERSRFEGKIEFELNFRFPLGFENTARQGHRYKRFRMP